MILLRMLRIRVYFKRNNIRENLKMLKIRVVSFVRKKDMKRKNVLSITLGVRRKVHFLIWSVLKLIWLQYLEILGG